MAVDGLQVHDATGSILQTKETELIEQSIHNSSSLTHSIDSFVSGD